jgi:micrococcal nuclease
MGINPARSRWALYILFVLVSALLIFILYPSSTQIGVTEVVDGDTIRLKSGEAVRYIGIDTPEEGASFFREASIANEEILKEGRIKLEYDREKKDRYGRILAYVWVDTLLVNAELIKRGLASVYMFSPNLRYRNLFVSLQKEARKKKLGIWSVPVSPEDYYVASRRSQRFVFHRPDCESAKKIRSENLIRFDSRNEALDSGYSPCRTCKP